MNRVPPMLLAMLLATPLLAAPNPAVEKHLAVAAAELAAAQGERDALKTAVNGAGEVSKAKDQVIAARDQRIVEIEAERDYARSWPTRFKVAGLVVLGLAFAVGFAIFLMGRQYVDAAVCGFIAIVGFGGSSAVARYDSQIGMVSLWAGGIGFIGGVAYLCFSVFRNRNAAEEHANVIPLAKKAGILTTDQIKKIDALAYQETGELADKVRARVTGKSKKDLAKAADIEVPPAASVVVPVSSRVAVTSGVVTPVDQ